MSMCPAGTSLTSSCPLRGPNEWGDTWTAPCAPQGRPSRLPCGQPVSNNIPLNRTILKPALVQAWPLQLSCQTKHTKMFIGLPPSSSFLYGSFTHFPPPPYSQGVRCHSDERNYCGLSEPPCHRWNDRFTQQRLGKNRISSFAPPSGSLA